MTDQEAFDIWASTHKIQKLVFGWYEKGNETELTLHGLTYYEGLAKAEAWGYREPKWYKPWTWRNWVITVG